MRKADADVCADTTFARIQSEIRIVALGDFRDDGETQTAAALPGAEDAIKTFEHTLPVLRVDAGAVVFHTQFGTIFTFIHTQ